MIKFNIIYLTITLILFSSCSNEIKKKDTLKEKNLELQVIEIYEEGLKELEDGYVLLAAKKFNEVEVLFPQSEWAPRSALMATYAYYSKDYYDEAIAEAKRFLRVYPLNQNLDYINYILGLSYYETIVDEKKDLQSIIEAKKYFKIVTEKYPLTEYATDADFKLDLINDILASKEMYIGRYYFHKKKWIPAINRFRSVIDDFDTTIYTEEALHRLVEVYYTIGLKEEAKKYAQILGYNYQSSEWYEKTYIVFDKVYENNKKLKAKNKVTKKKLFLKKIKSFFNSNE
jgi:outer membrane protein assembly factor BamD